MTYLEQYLSGQREQVWADLLDQGERVREEPLFSDAYAVALETMRRASANVETLVPRLRALGYWFDGSVNNSMRHWFRAEQTGAGARVLEDHEIHAPPAPDTAQRIARLEELAGEMPLSIRAWYEVVGGVNFVGKHPGWKYGAGCYADPLVVDPLGDDVFRAFREWQEEMKEFEGEEEYQYPFVLAFSADHLTKQGISGGGPYGFVLPDLSADGVIDGEERYRTTFVNYLRLCFRWGGFPGFEFYPGGAVPREDVAILTAGLVLKQANFMRGSTHVLCCG